jgi:hypothetical protein
MAPDLAMVRDDVARCTIDAHGLGEQRPRIDLLVEIG